MKQNFSLLKAKRDAKFYSNKYLTFWFVVQLATGEYQVRAHGNGDQTDVACYYCGEDWSAI